MKKDKESISTISDDTDNLQFVIRRHPVTKQNVVYKTIEASMDDITDAIVPFNGVGQ